MQPCAPVADSKNPFGHGVHAVFPAAPAYVPAKHASQEVRSSPRPSCAVPFGQSVVATPSQKEPGAHLAHSRSVCVSAALVMNCVFAVHTVWLAHMRSLVSVCIFVSYSTVLHCSAARQLALPVAGCHASAPHAKVLGMPDSGFWPDDTAQGFSHTFNSMYAMQNNKSSYFGMVKNCKWKTSNVSKCLFPQYFADEIETPLFPLQSIYDPLQKGKE